MIRRSATWALGFFAAAAAVGACSAATTSGGFSSDGSGASETSSGPAGQGGGSSGSFVTTGTSSMSGSPTMSGTNTGTSTSSLGVGGGCAGSSTKAQLRPLDMYIMLDQSSSMSDPVAGGTTKWKAVTSALKSFIADPGSAGLGVGIGYFAVPPQGSSSCNTTCQTAADCGGPGCGPCEHIGGMGICIGGAGSTDSCQAADYAIPDVEIATLPGTTNAQVDALDASLMAHHPSTSTPTAPALQGAIQHATSWQVANPTHVAVVLLATDGEPTECSPTNPGQIGQLAAAAYMGNPSIATFVIGVGNVNALNTIAADGGTGQAFIVNTQQDVTMQFIAALNTIRGAALGCTYVIPQPTDGSMLDPTKVNVQYTPGGSTTPETIPEVSDILHCPTTGDAWYYDNPAMPTEIVMCSNTCATLSADTMGEVDIVLGCASVVH